MEQLTSWYDIYSERMNERYRQHLATKYGPFIKALYEVGAKHSFEVGCGAGNITRILREMRGYNSSFRRHTMVDSCPKMLSLAIENNQGDANCSYVCADITKAGLSESDLVHSHGLLEHFADGTIQRTVEMGLHAAPVQLHYVPGAKYRVPSRGDERLLEPQQWSHILRYYKHDIITFNDDYDIIIRVER